MTNKKFYRCVIQFEILSEEPFDDSISLETIAEEVDTGSWSGMFLDDIANEEVDGATMAKLLTAQGSDPGFFQLDEDGNSTDEDDDSDDTEE